jgi:glycosyltransferase involved in cell wall biosynthesis
MTRPLNVARIISMLTVGGVQSMLLSTLPCFDKRRFNVRVCCTDRIGKVGRALQQRGVSVDLCRIRSRLHPVDLWSMAKWLKKNQIDIVHTHMYASNISGTVAAKMAGVPIIISHIHAAHEWRSRHRALIERLLDRSRSGYIAVSEAVREAFLEKTGLDCRDRIRVIQNVHRFTEEDVAPDPRALRQELRIPAASPVVGTITRLVPVKGLDVLLRAARLVADHLPEARFVIVGKGREKAALAGLTSELGLERNVIFTGERVDVKDFYSLFDLFVLSSHSEGFGIVLLEAMHFGTPIVATAVGGIPELVRDGETGLLAPPDSPGPLADAILKLLGDPALARHLSCRALEYSRNFAPSSYVAQVERYYTELHERAQDTKSA